MARLWAASTAFSFAFGFDFAAALLFFSDDAVVLLQVQAKASAPAVAEPRWNGASVSLTEEGYQSVASLNDGVEMETFVLRKMDALGLRLANDQHLSLSGFTEWFSGQKAVQSLHNMSAELRAAAWVVPKERHRQETEMLDSLPATLRRSYSNQSTLTEATYAAKTDAKTAFRVADKNHDGKLNEREAITAGISKEEFQRLDTAHSGSIAKEVLKNMQALKAENDFYAAHPLTGNTTANTQAISIAKAITQNESPESVLEKRGAAVLVASELVGMPKTNQQVLLASLNDTRIVLQTAAGAPRLLSVQQIADKLDDGTLAALAGLPASAPGKLAATNPAKLAATMPDKLKGRRYKPSSEVYDLEALKKATKSPAKTAVNNTAMGADEAWQKGDLVEVEGQTGIINWDGRPGGHAFASVFWELNATESDVIPAEKIKLKNKEPIAETESVDHIDQ